MTTSDFLTKLSQTLLLEEPALTPATDLTSLPAWDSMGMVAVLSMIDESLGATLPRGALQKCATVNDIMALVKSQA